MILLILLAFSNILWAVLYFYQSREHEKFIKWIFLDWAWKIKTGEFDQGPEPPKGPDVKELMQKFLTLTHSNDLNKNAIARSKMIKSKVI